MTDHILLFKNFHSGLNPDIKSSFLFCFQPLICFSLHPACIFQNRDSLFVTDLAKILVKLANRVKLLWLLQAHDVVDDLLDVLAACADERIDQLLALGVQREERRIGAHAVASAVVLDRVAAAGGTVVTGKTQISPEITRCIR